MKILNSILFIYLSTFFSCGFNGLQDLKEIDHIINKSVENEHPGLGVGIVKNGGSFMKNIEVSQTFNIKSHLVKRQDQT